MVDVARGKERPVVHAPARFLIVQAPYYETIGALLLRGAQAVLAAAGATVDVVTVPGSLEIPAAVAICRKTAEARGKPYAGAVALGCIMRGETYHFEIVANESARGLTLIGIEHAFPLGNGILTVENEEQALHRAEPEQGDKGGEAAHAAILLWALSRADDAAR